MVGAMAVAMAETMAVAMEVIATVGKLSLCGVPNFGAPHLRYVTIIR